MTKNKKYTMEVVIDPPRSVDENNHDYVRLHVESSSEACLKWFAEAFKESSLENRLVAVFDILEEEDEVLATNKELPDFSKVCFDCGGPIGACDNCG